MSDYYPSGNTIPLPRCVVGYKKTIIIIALVAVVLGVLFYFSNKTPVDTGPKPLSREEIMKRQIAELNRLREESALGPITVDEQKGQIAELNKLRKQSKTKPLSEEVTDKQIEELNKLRSPGDNN